MNPAEVLIGKQSSLRRGLFLNIIIAASVCVSVAFYVLVSEFTEHLEGKLESDMTREAAEVAASINPALPSVGLDGGMLRFRGSGGFYRYTVFDGEGHTLVGGETSPEIVAQLTKVEPDRPHVMVLEHGRLGMALRKRIEGTDFIVMASMYTSASEKTALQTLIYEIKENFGWVVLGVTVLLAAAFLATWRALRPLQAVSKQARSIDLNASGNRLSTRHLPSEVKPLIEAVNDAFDRLEDGYQAQRDFSSNVAHEIRNPLAVLRSELDKVSDPEVRAALSADIGRIDRIFEQLIDLARADALGGAPHEVVDLHELAVGVAREKSIGAIRAGKTLALTGAASVRVRGNPVLLSTALSNLVRNALNYSPKGAEIEIEITRSPPGWRVLDRGPGVPDGQKRALFIRFHRGSQWSGKPAGAGLGLTIVKSVAAAHGATIRIEDRPGGGSVFVFTFPGIPDTAA